MELISLAICEVETSSDELKHGWVDFLVDSVWL